MVDAAGLFEQSVTVPVRQAPKRLLIGVRVGAEHSLAELAGPRAGLELWVPFRLGDTFLGLGVTGSLGRASQTVSDAAGQISSESQALFAPIGLRLGLELFALRQLSLWVGGGATAALARFETSLTGRRVETFGLGGLGYAALTWAAGPGELFSELSIGTAPVATPDFRLETGGVGIALGYRLGVF
jgi:hypothetical protein